MPKERGETGQFVETVTSEDVLDVFDGVDGPPVVTSADVADATGLSRDSARRKLSGLYDEGRVGRRESAGRVLYWLTDWRTSTPPAPETHDDEPTPDEPERHEEGETGAESAASETGAPTTPETPNANSDDVRAGESDVRAQAGERIDELDLPGSGVKYDRRREAVLMIHDHLRANPGEWFQKGDFAELLDSVDLGGYASFDSLWSNWVKGSGDKPNVLKTLPGVELSDDDYQYHPADESDETAASGESGGVYDPTDEFDS